MSEWVEPKAECIEVTTWSRTRRHLSDPKRKVLFQGTYRLVVLCQTTEADTEAGWTERYPQFWLAVKPFAELPMCKQCVRVDESEAGS